MNAILTARNALFNKLSPLFPALSRTPTETLDADDPQTRTRDGYGVGIVAVLQKPVVDSFEHLLGGGGDMVVTINVEMAADGSTDQRREAKLYALADSFRIAIDADPTLSGAVSWAMASQLSSETDDTDGVGAESLTLPVTMTLSAPSAAG